MPKRTPIKGLGSDAWFTSTQEVLEEPHTGKTANKQDSKTASPPLVKATFYLTPDHITALEELKLKHLKETGERIDKSELVRRAIRLLENQLTSKTAS